MKSSSASPESVSALLFSVAALPCPQITRQPHSTIELLLISHDNRTINRTTLENYSEPIRLSHKDKATIICHTGFQIAAYTKQLTLQCLYGQKYSTDVNETLCKRELLLL